MNDTGPPGELDWRAVQHFLALFEAGSLGRAARTLGLSQPTLTRRLAEIEGQLGQLLFERSARGLRPTAAALALHEPAVQMRAQAAHWARTAAAVARREGGVLRLTSSEVVAAFVLPPLLADWRRRWPDMPIELVASDTVQDLREHRADLALRMTRPQEPELIARRLRDEAVGLYAHRDYLARHGAPEPGTLTQHTWVGDDRGDLVRRGFATAGRPVARGFFAFRCDHPIAAWQAVRAGVGIGAGLVSVASQDAALVRVLPEWKIAPLPMWLVAHREARQTPHLRRVWEALVAALAR